MIYLYTVCIYNIIYICIYTSIFIHTYIYIYIYVCVCIYHCLRPSSRITNAKGETVRNGAQVDEAVAMNAAQKAVYKREARAEQDAIDAEVRTTGRNSRLDSRRRTRRSTTVQ